jgi:predicted TIM-barrel fold metal-dependent hydrolase
VDVSSRSAVANSEETRTNRYVVISSDGHCGGDILEYKAYLPRAWHDDFDAWADSYVSPFEDSVGATGRRNWDSRFRTAEIDADGIAGEVLFPNTIPPFFETVGIIGIGLPRSAQQLQRRWVGLQAHNRWLVDFCSQEALRRRGIIQVFPNDVDAAVEEIRWASEQTVLGGVLLPAVPPNDAVEPYFHRRYEPIWRVCEERGFPVCHHSGSGIPDMPWSEPGGMSIMEVEAPLWTKRTLTHLVLGGVFERFPGLKYAQTEMGGLEWVVDAGFAMDFSVAQQTSTANRTRSMFADETTRSLSLKPSEYIRRNVFHGASVMAAHDVRFTESLGVDRIMWGTDYPHESCSTPQSREALRWTFADVSDTECRLMMAENAAELYHFDLEALASLELGPTSGELHVPLPGPEISDQQRRMQSSGTGDRSIRPFEGGTLLPRASVAPEREKA